MQGTKTASNESSVRSEKISWRRLPGVALLAAITAAIANTLVYFAASGLGFISRDVLVSTSGGESPITAGMVAGASLAGAVGAAIVFAVVGLLARHPFKLFQWIAVVVLVVSLVPPLTIPGAPVAMILTLEVMHVAAWAVIVGLLTNLARRKEHA
jgi:hypothetical protein